jgi:hypothetical protein
MTVVVAPPPWQYYPNPNNSGSPAAGFKLFIYQAGTSTKQNTWTDSTQTVLNANPLIIDANGFASAASANYIWGDPSIAIKYVWAPANDTDPPSSPLRTVDNVYLPVAFSSITATFIGTLLYPLTAAEIAAGITPTNYAYPSGILVDMRRYGISPNGVNNTATVQAVFNMMKTTGVGGTMLFPCGDWAFYLDISGITNAPVTIDGQGSTFRPFTSSPTNSTIVFADNSGSGYFNTNVIFRRCTFIARTYGSSSTGDLNYAVYHKYASSKFYDSDFEYGKTASFYCLYGQYTEFWSCSFDSSANSTTSAGCLLDSNTVSAASNEVNFNRCKFFSNSIGAWTKGTIAVRFRDCTFQGQVAGAAGALILDQDGSGSSTQDTIIDGCWFEANNTTNHIKEVAGSKTRLVNCQTFASGGTNAIAFAHCNDLVVLGLEDYDLSLAVTINHPGGNTDTTRLTWHGNNITPTVSVNHAGSALFDIVAQGSFTGTLTGCTGSPTGLIKYSVNGDAVTLVVNADILGTSNASAKSVTGLPSLLTPQGPTLLMLAVIENNTAIALGQTSITTGGTINLFADTSGSAFVSSGTAGIKAQTLPTYRLST